MKTDETDFTGPDLVVDVLAEEGDVAASHLPLLDQAEILAFEGDGVVEVVGHVLDSVTEGEGATLVMAEEALSGSTSRSASADVLPATPRFRFRLPRLGRKVAIGLAAVFLLAFSGVAYATYDYDKNYDGKLLPGIVIGGVHVGGMTPDEALHEINDAARIKLGRNISVRYKEKRWNVTPRELGAESNAQDLVDSAVFAGENTGLLKKVGLAVFGGRLNYERDLAITYPKQGINAFIDGVAASLNRDPIDADVDYSTGWLEFTEAKEGRHVRKGESRAALQRALRREEPQVTLVVDATEPAITEHEWDQALLLRIGENKLYLYQDGEITHEYVVATGEPSYPTPTGEYYITEKRYLPTWVNPDPEGWGAGMPLMIPPGPGNPLGTRALNWSASGIRFHGTEATYSLGYNASHGCVRMAMADVEELYDLVDVGTPIVSLIASPLDPMYTSSPDPGPPPAPGVAN